MYHINVKVAASDSNCWMCEKLYIISIKHMQLDLMQYKQYRLSLLQPVTVYFVNMFVWVCR